MKESFTVSEHFNASPMEIYLAWLNSEKHSAMTGGVAKVSDLPGESYSAWDGYIYGKNIKLDPGKLIVQSWRTNEFGAVEEDSQVEVILEPENSGTRLTLNHTNIPETQFGYKDGWKEYYFTNMKTYFSNR